MEVTLAPTQLDASWATSVLWFKNIQMLYIVQILQLSNWCYLPENCILITMIDKMQEHTMKRKKVILWISWHSRKMSRMVFKQWSNVHTYSTNVLYQASYHHEAYDRQNMLYNLLQDDEMQIPARGMKKGWFSALSQMAEEKGKKSSFKG